MGSPPAPRPREESAIVVALEDEERHAPRSQPIAQPTDVLCGPSTGPGRLDEVAGDDQPRHLDVSEHPREPLHGLLERMSRHAITRRGPRPLVAQVHVGDHSTPIPRVDRGPFGR